MPISARSETYRTLAIVCLRRRGTANTSAASATGPFADLEVLSGVATRVSGVSRALERDRTALAPAITPASGQNWPEALIARSRTAWMASAAVLDASAALRVITCDPSAAACGEFLAAGGSGAGTRA